VVRVSWLDMPGYKKKEKKKKKKIDIIRQRS
jgi:hypothetical protein